MTALKPCGTPAAYQRHRNHGEPICDPCREAFNAAQRNNERFKKRGRARMRALIRLSEIYATAYDALFEEEMRKEGL